MPTLHTLAAFLLHFCTLLLLAHITAVVISLYVHLFVCLSAVRCCCRLHIPPLSLLFCSLWKQSSSLHSLCLIAPTRSSDPLSSHATLLFSIFPPPYLLFLLWEKEGTKKRHTKREPLLRRLQRYGPTPITHTVFGKHAPPHVLVLCASPFLSGMFKM